MLPAGFSLVELLGVIAVIGVLMLLAVPAITSLNRAGQMGNAVDEVASLIELARTEAMARNTYVWVGFANLGPNSTGNTSGLDTVAAAAFASPDGTATSSLAPISLTKTLRAPGLRLVDGSWTSSELSSDLKTKLTAEKYTEGTRTPAPVPLADNPTNRTGLTQNGITFNKTLTITPQGQMMLKPQPTGTDGFNFVISLGLQRRPVSASPDDAALWLYGGSGQIRTFRL